MSVKFSLDWDLLDCEFLDTLIYMTTPTWVSVCVGQVYRLCPVMFMEYKTLTYLVILNMEEFDIIL